MHINHTSNLDKRKHPTLNAHLRKCITYMDYTQLYALCIWSLVGGDQMTKLPEKLLEYVQIIVIASRLIINFH